MKSYYEDTASGIVIYHGDCREVLPTLPDECVDAVVTDPPFLKLVGGYKLADWTSGVGKRIHASTAVGDPWQANLEWSADAARISRFGVIVFCTYHSIPEVSQAFPFRRAALWSWHKRNAPMTGANVPRFTEEHVWGFAKKPGLKWDAIKTTLIDIPTLSAGCMASAERFVDATGKAIHPTQKPLAVMDRLLQVVPSSVCDPFCGLGTTLVAAKNRGLNGIGIEQNEAYCEIAANRLAQGVLFGAAS